MLPVAILRFSPTEGPGYFGAWLAAQGRPSHLVALDQGESVPSDPDAFAGIGMMGGPMSANDATPWREPLAAFLQRAVDGRVPVIGHCLGGQVLARALGGTVARAPVTEIGWLDAEASDADAAREWFGGQRRMTVFQWHYDGFTLPPGAARVLTGAVHANQAFVLDDRHIGLQGHIEMTRELVRTWCDGAPGELPAQSSAAQQARGDIERDLDARLAALHGVADAVYARWSRHLRA